MERVEQIALKTEGVADTIRFDGLNPLTQVNQSNSGAVYVVLKPWEERKAPECGPGPWSRRLQQALAAEVQDALALVFPPPPIQGLGTTGGFEFLIEDREGRGVQALADVTDRFMAEARSRPELSGLYTPFSVRVPQLRFELDRGKARNLEVPVSSVFETLQVYLGGFYVNDFNRFGKTWRVYVQSERRPPPDGQRYPDAQGPEQQRRPRPLERPWCREADRRPDRRSALQSLQRGQDHRQPRPRLQLGTGHPCHAGSRGGDSSRGLRL